MIERDPKIEAERARLNALLIEIAAQLKELRGAKKNALADLALLPKPALGRRKGSRSKSERTEQSRKAAGQIHVELRKYRTKHRVGKTPTEARKQIIQSALSSHPGAVQSIVERHVRTHEYRRSSIRRRALAKSEEIT